MRPMRVGLQLNMEKSTNNDVGKIINSNFIITDHMWDSYVRREPYTIWVRNVMTKAFPNQKYTVAARSPRCRARPLNSMNAPR